MELAAGIAGYIRRSDVETMLKSTANSTMYACTTDPRMEETWNIVQHEVFKFAFLLLSLKITRNGLLRLSTRFFFLVYCLHSLLSFIYLMLN